MAEKLTPEEIIGYLNKCNDREASVVVVWKVTEQKPYIVTVGDVVDLINRQQADIENLNNFLYDAEGVNLVNYWYQQCEIAENGCRNLEEENKKLKAEIERLQKHSKKVLETCSRVTKANDERNNEIFQGAIEVVRAEAIKEFKEKLIDLSSESDLYDRDERWVQAITVDEINETYKEMVGEDK